MSIPFNVKQFAALRLAPVLSLKASSSDSGDIYGYASAFDGVPDSYGDVIAKGAFLRTLAEHKQAGTSPAMLWAHDQARPVGRWIDITEDGYGLKVHGRFNLATTEGRNAFEHAKNGDVTGFSIGYRIPDGGAKQVGGAQVLTDIDLAEVSVVAIPANRRARVTGVKSITSKTELIELLRSGGLPKAAAARVAAGGWPALSPDLENAEALDKLGAALRRSVKLMRNV